MVDAVNLVQLEKLTVRQLGGVEDRMPHGRRSSRNVSVLAVETLREYWDDHVLLRPVEDDDGKYVDSDAKEK